MRFRSRPRRSISLNVTPLIDVVFLLVLFFSVTTTFSAGEIALRLPEGGSRISATERGTIQLVVSLDDRGGIWFDHQVVSKQELMKKLQSYSEQSSHVELILRADAKTAHGNVVDVLDAARQVGLSRLLIATRPGDVTD